MDTTAIPQTAAGKQPTARPYIEGPVPYGKTSGPRLYLVSLDEVGNDAETHAIYTADFSSLKKDLDTLQHTIPETPMDLITIMRRMKMRLGQINAIREAWNLPRYLFSELVGYTTLKCRETLPREMSSWRLKENILARYPREGKDAVLVNLDLDMVPESEHLTKIRSDIIEYHVRQRQQQLDEVAKYEAWVGIQRGTTECCDDDQDGA